jgi:hypothetical protein
VSASRFTMMLAWAVTAPAAITAPTVHARVHVTIITCTLFISTCVLQVMVKEAETEKKRALAEAEKSAEVRTEKVYVRMYDTTRIAYVCMVLLVSPVYARMYGATRIAYDAWCYSYRRDPRVKK